MPPVRIVLARLPALTADVLAAIVADDRGLLQVADLDADVAIVSAAPDGLAAEALPLLCGHPELVVLGVDPRDGLAASLRMSRHGRPGADELRALLRSMGPRE